MDLKIGKTWKNMGLKNSEHISKIIVSPKDSDVVFVASQGPLWSSGGERGLYKTNDGGKTWKNVLSVNEWTGVTDVVINEQNPNIFFTRLNKYCTTVSVILLFAISFTKSILALAAVPNNANETTIGPIAVPKELTPPAKFNL